MIKRLLFCILTLILTGTSLLNATNSVPLTTLTKNCKPIINKNLIIKEIPVIAFSERVNIRISRALNKLSEEKYDEAILQLKALFNNSKNQNVQSIAAKYLGVTYARLSNSKEATFYFEKSVALGKQSLPHKNFQDLIQNVAVMHYSNGNKPKALEYLERWIDNSNLENEQIFLLYAATLMDSGQFENSVCPAYWSAKSTKTPHKNALNILLNAHYQLKEFDEAIAVLKQLIQDFPNEKRYWRNLATVYVSQDRLSEALVVMELFYLQGLMDKESDFVLLSQMFAHNDIPYRTATVLKEGMDKGIVKSTDENWSDIASNFHLAGELKNAIEAYTESAERTLTGEIDLKRAELLADSEQFLRAVTGFDQALKKGSLKDPGKAYFRKGLALFGLKLYDQAISSLDKANKYVSWRKRASQWTEYIKRHKKQIASL